jgi:hypothetical protein
MPHPEKLEETLLNDAREWILELKSTTDPDKRAECLDNAIGLMIERAHFEDEMQMELAL